MSVPDLRTQRGPHVFVDDLDIPVLDDDDRHHLTKSLRLRSGDSFTISNGHGDWRPAIFGDVIEPTGPIIHVPAPLNTLGIGIALTKAAKPELAVQKATEIGIDAVVVFEAQHSVARWNQDKRARNQQRLRRIAREAAMQSHRVRLPDVWVVQDLDEVQTTAPFADSPIYRADFGGEPVNSDHRFVLIGPEGGWSDEERTVLPNAVDLGSTVLRAETAALVVSTQLVRSRDRHG